MYQSIFIQHCFFFLTDISPRLSLLVIIILSLCCLNSYNGDFVFDDSEAIVNNKDVKDSPLKDVFENDFWGAKLSRNDSHKSYRPLTILSFRYDKKIIFSTKVLKEITFFVQVSLLASRILRPQGLSHCQYYVVHDSLCIGISSFSNFSF